MQIGTKNTVIQLINIEIMDLIKMNKRSNVVLNFDDSTGLADSSLVLDLQQWQEDIRFGCSWKKFNHLSEQLEKTLPCVDNLGCVLMGSGDYHHITQILLSRIKKPIHLIVCDNHPDNMRYPFGIHCGSWVYWASRLPQVVRIDVIGICSSDISLKHAWENHWSPLYKGKLHYWTIHQNPSWMNWIGAEKNKHVFHSADELMTNFLQTLVTFDIPKYLSVDKDVLAQTEVQTNWDQGEFLYLHLQQLIQSCQSRLIGADITGDVSAYQYRSKFKRFLSESDGQNEQEEDQIKLWQIDQIKMNQKLVDQLQQCFIE